jgi:hypothetical protein
LLVSNRIGDPFLLVLTAGRLYVADKKGLPEVKLSWFFFLELHGGKGKANDNFGSVYGWLVSKDAPKETLDFMKVWLGKETQTNLPPRVFLSRWSKGPQRRSRVLSTRPSLWRWIIRAGFAKRLDCSRWADIQPQKKAAVVTSGIDVAQHASQRLIVFGVNVLACEGSSAATRLVERSGSPPASISQPYAPVSSMDKV